MEKLLTIDNLSETLTVSVHTLYKWVGKNKIPFTKLPNGELRFEQNKIKAWIKINSATATVAGITI